MTDFLKIACIRECQYLEAFPGDCVMLTFVGNRFAPVKPRMCGTLTLRGGNECGVVVIQNERLQDGRPS